MADLRCDRTIHAKTLGSILEVRCRDCCKVLSGPGRNVSVYHRWEYRDGKWLDLNDRIDVHEPAPAAENALIA